MTGPRSPPRATWPPTPAWPRSPAAPAPRSTVRAAHRGNHALKSALFLSAFASLKDPASRAYYYDRKRAEKKKHNAAIICLARRRVDVLFAMLRDGTPYQRPTSREPNPTTTAA